MSTSESSPGRRPRLSRRLVLAALAGLLGLGVWTFRTPLFANNWGVVDPGVVYRSAQPDQTLDDRIAEYQIASILNLRGGSPNDDFYADEVRTANELGVQFYDVPLSATRRPGRQELLALVDVIDRARYPMLIHCKQGADRTGLAASLYYLLKRNEDPRLAERGFRLDHAHLPLLGPEKLHEPLVEYAAWLERERQPHTPERFRDWLAWDYDDEDPPGPLARRVRPGPRPMSARRKGLVQQATRPTAVRH